MRSIPQLIVLALMTSFLSFAGDRVIPHIPHDADHLTTEVRLFNTHDQNQTVTIIGYSRFGDELAQSVLSLEPSETRSLQADELGGADWVLLTGDDSVRVTTRTRTSHPHSGSAFASAVSASSCSWLVNTGNPGGANRVAMVNRGFQATTVYITVRNQSGVVKASHQQDLAAGARLVWPLGVKVKKNEELQVELQSAQPLVVSSTGYSSNRKYVWHNQAIADNTPKILQIPLQGEFTFPEGIAIHQQSGEVFTGSLYEGSIQRVLRGQVSYFKTAGEDGLISVTGMTVDQDRNRLWACNSDLFTFGTPELMVWDIASGNLLARFPVPDQINYHFLNDITLDSNGNAYITDSLSPIIWTVDANLTGMEIYLEDAQNFNLGGGFNLNGITFTPDERYLMVFIPAQNGSTIYRIDHQTREVTAVTISGGFFGGDGVVFQNDRELLSIAYDIYRVSFDCDYSRADVVSYPQISAHLDNATTGKILGDNLIVVNSQLDDLFGGAQPDPFTLTSVPLQLLR